MDHVVPPAVQEVDPFVYDMEQISQADVSADISDSESDEDTSSSVIDSYLMQNLTPADDLDISQEAMSEPPVPQTKSRPEDTQGGEEEIQEEDDDLSIATLPSSTPRGSVHSVHNNYHIEFDRMGGPAQQHEVHPDLFKDDPHKDDYIEESIVLGDPSVHFVQVTDSNPVSFVGVTHMLDTGVSIDDPPLSGASTHNLESAGYVESHASTVAYEPSTADNSINDLQGGAILYQNHDEQVVYAEDQVYVQDSHPVYIDSRHPEPTHVSRKRRHHPTHIRDFASTSGHLPFIRAHSHAHTRSSHHSQNHSQYSMTPHLYSNPDQPSVFHYGPPPMPKRNPHADPTYFYQEDPKRIPFPQAHISAHTSVSLPPFATTYQADPTLISCENESLLFIREKTKIQNELMQVYNRLVMIPGCDGPAEHIRAAWNQLKDGIFYHHLQAERQNMQMTRQQTLQADHQNLQIGMQTLQADQQNVQQMGRHSPRQTVQAEQQHIHPVQHENVDIGPSNLQLQPQTLPSETQNLQAQPTMYVQKRASEDIPSEQSIQPSPRSSNGVVESVSEPPFQFEHAPTKPRAASYIEVFE